MALPIIANVYRITFNFNSVGGVTPHNVIHVRAASSDEADVAAKVDLALTSSIVGDANMWSPLPVEYQLQTYTVLKLDGSSGSIEATPTTAMGGDSSGQPSPASAAVVKFGTGLRGPRHRGRAFIGPVREGVMNAGILDTASVNITTLGWNQFGASLVTNTGPQVVASYAHGDANDVIQWVCEPVLGTMGRRQNQLR